MKKAVFLDRDGVISRSEVRDGRPYAPRRLEDFEILPEVPGALAQLREAGFLLIVVTNQPDVGNGFVEREIIEKMHEEMCQAVAVDDVRVCYASQKEGSPFRKPKPGMLLEAAEKWGIDLGQSFMVGDRWSDVEAGRAAGCQTILIQRNYTEKQAENPNFTAASLEEASKIILKKEIKELLTV